MTVVRALLLCTLIAYVFTAHYDSWEVWNFDQADTVPTGGGLIYIYNERSYITGKHVELWDLATMATAAGCPIGRKPHMSAAWPVPTPDNPTPNMTHVTISNFQSGSFFIIEIRTRTIVGCFDLLTQSNGDGRLHNVYIHTLSPKTAILFALSLGPNNANGFIHRVFADFSINRYTYLDTYSLDPIGVQLGQLVRPICAARELTRGYWYVTLQQGGVIVIDPGTNTVPLTVKHAYDRTVAPGSGSCIDVYTATNQLITSGESLVYENLENAPTNDTINDFIYFWPNGFLARDDFGTPLRLDIPRNDIHGTALCRTATKKEFLLAFMRLSSDVHIIDLDTKRIAKTIFLGTTESPIPSPDICQTEVGFNEGSWRLWVTLRGAVPLSAITYSDPRRTPGIASLVVSQDCLDVSWAANSLFRVDANATLIGSDPHGMHKFYFKNPVVPTPAPTPCPSCPQCCSKGGNTNINFDFGHMLG